MIVVMRADECDNEGWGRALWQRGNLQRNEGRTSLDSDEHGRGSQQVHWRRAYNGIVPVIGSLAE